MAVALEPEQVTRLSLIRYLLRHAERQCTEPQPACSLALLPMHDAAEMFLDLIAESHGAASQSRNFMDYWDALSKSRQPVQLPMRRAMEKLNRARVAIKHHGLRTSDDQVREHLANVKAFFEDTSEQCFGYPLSDVSMIGLI